MGGDVGKASWRWYLSLALKDYIALAKMFFWVFFFFHKMLQKNLNKIFDQPNITSMGKIRKGHSRKRKEPIRLSLNTLKAAVPHLPSLLCRGIMRVPETSLL